MPAVPARLRQTTLDAFRVHLNGSGYKGATVEVYARTVDRWLRSGQQGPRWLAARREESRSHGLPTSSSKDYQKALLVFYRWLQWDVDPLYRALPRQHRYRHARTPTALSVDDDVRLLDALHRGAVEEPYRTLIFLLRTLGLRTSEACALRLVDLRPGPAGLVLCVAEGKGRSAAAGDRPEPLGVPRAAAALLASYLREGRPGPQPSPWLFPSPQNPTHPVTTRSVHRALKRLAYVAELSRVPAPHELRHTTATRLLEAGVDQRLISAALRHQSSATTRRYQHPDPDALRQALEKP